MHQTLFPTKGDDDQIFLARTGFEDWLVDTNNAKLEKPPNLINDQLSKHFSVRALEYETGISKTQISLSLQRMEQVGLQKTDRKLGVPKTNSKALLEFIAYGIRYVFPATERELTRGIATSIAAPILQGRLMSAGDLVPVWSNAKGKTKGLSIEPLHTNIYKAVRADPRMYAYLALTDAIRLGNPRERNLALDMLQKLFRVSL